MKIVIRRKKLKITNTHRTLDLTTHQINILVFLALFFFLSILPIYGFFVKDSTNTENRDLKNFPKVELNQNLLSFPEKFDLAFNDRFGFRRNFIRFYNYLNLKLFNHSDVEEVVIGKDNWFFYNDGAAIESYVAENLFADKELKEWQNYLEERNQFFQQRGIEYYFLIVPNKNTIYPEYLPEIIKKVNSTSRLDQLIAHMQIYSDVKIIDLRVPLISAKGKYRLYSQHDTHWNSYGTYLGYQSVMKEVLPEVKQIGPEILVIHQRDRGGADMKTNLLALDQLVYEYDAPSVRIKNKEKSFELISIKEERDKTYVNESLSEPNVVMAGDSFLFVSNFIQYIAQSVHSLKTIDFKTKLEEIDPYLKDNKVDIFIEEMIERGLIRSKRLTGEE